MKKRSIFFITSLLIIGVLLIIGFGFNKLLPINDDKKFEFYWVVKIVTLSLFLIIALYIILRKQDPAHKIIIYSSTVAIQLLPLLVRLLLRGNDSLYTVSILVSAIIIVLYIILVFTFEVLLDKTNAAEEKLIGKSITVVSEEEYFDSEGNFTGVNHKAPKRDEDNV